MTYLVAMATPPAFPHEGWERTPPEAQAYIQALEARVETLASIVHAFQHVALGVSDVVAANRGTLAIRAPGSL